MTPTTTTPNADRLRYVYSRRVRCPSCGSVDHQTVRSTDQGDGSRMVRKRCRECGHPFIVILE